MVKPPLVLVSMSPSVLLCVKYASAIPIVQSVWPRSPGRFRTQRPTVNLILAFWVVPSGRVLGRQGGPQNEHSRHPRAPIYFDSGRILVENRIGEEDEGFKICMCILDLNRPTIGATAVGHQVIDPEANVVEAT